MITVVALGDVVGKPGRQCLDEHIPEIRKKFAPDLVVLNGENLAGGFGLTKKIFLEILEKHGIDCIATGNHWADKREIYDFMDHERLLLPANAKGVPAYDHGLRILKTSSGTQVAFVNLIGKVFMHPDNTCPFKAADAVFERIPDYIKTRIVDVHAEATSEKQALGHYLTQRASLLYGTHSHVQTADERILGGRLGYLTDVGMTGPYDSIIGMKTNLAMKRFLTGQKEPLEPAKNDPWICFLVAKIDEETGICAEVTRHRWSPEKTVE
ncbi:MAG: YmdB family metallophosphoesterase [Oligoflexales bacterium]